MLKVILRVSHCLKSRDFDEDPWAPNQVGTRYLSKWPFYRRGDAQTIAPCLECAIKLTLKERRGRASLVERAGVRQKPQATRL